MDKVLIFTSTTLHNSPRIIKEIEMLQSSYVVYAIGTTAFYNNNITSISFNEVTDNYFDKLQNKITNILSRYNYTSTLFFKNYKIRKLLNQINPKIVITHDPKFLPYLVRRKYHKNFKLIYNAHEYHPLEYEDRKQWMKRSGKIYFNIYKKYLDKVDLLINVSNGIVDKCFSQFNVNSLLIPNVTNYHNIKPVFNIEKKIKIIHHGLPIKERQIEIMINAVSLLSNQYELDLMIVKGNDDYFNYLQKLINKTTNVRIIPIVEYKNIIEKIKSYDIGIYNLPPTSFNNKYALPNKFFEFIQARLCLVIGPSYEMKKIVENYNIGLIANDFTEKELIRTLSNLKREDIQKFKLNTDKAARDLNSESYYEEYMNKLKLL